MAVDDVNYLINVAAFDLRKNASFELETEVLSDFMSCFNRSWLFRMLMILRGVKLRNVLLVLSMLS